MRPDAAGAVRRPPESKHEHSTGQVLLAAVLMAAVFAAPLVAVSYPLATALAVGAAVAVGAARRALGRRRSRRAADVCVPRTDDCASA